MTWLMTLNKKPTRTNHINVDKIEMMLNEVK